MRIGKLLVELDTERALPSVEALARAGDGSGSEELVVLRAVVCNESARLELDSGDLISPFVLRLASVPDDVVAATINSIASLVGGDARGSVERLLPICSDKTIANESRDSLLELVCRICAAHGLGFSESLASLVLSESSPSGSMVYSVSCLLFVDLVRATSNQEVSIGAESIRRRYVEVLLHALTAGAFQPERLYSLARELPASHSELADQLYYEIARVAPSYERRWYWHRDLGLRAYARSDLAAARKFYDRAASLKPIDSELFRMAGDAYYYSGDWLEAGERYRRALRIEPVERHFVDLKLPPSANVREKPVPSEISVGA